MSNQTQTNSDKIEKSLLKQQKEVEAEIKSLEQDDPVNSLGMAESSEPGTDSWVADTHGRVMAMKQSLKSLLERIKAQLAALKSGKYGKCSNCGNQIEPQRLVAMPTANLCINCSKKTKK